jgi:leucyl aminopeptidase (aminopeptidase T)
MNGARTVVANCLNIKPLEKVLIITDNKMLKFGKVIFDASKEINLETFLLMMESTGSHGGEPPEIVAKAMKSSNVVIAPTYYSLTHTKARKDACDAGARIATMPRVTELSFTKGGLTADYTEVRKLTEKMFEVLKDAELVEVKSKNGTDVNFSVKTLLREKDTGIIHNSGEYGNLPAGEVATAPDEGTTNGKIVFDFSNYGKKIELIVKDGFVQETDSKKLEKVFEMFGEKARNIAEFGIGTNTKAKVIDSILEIEKIHGTIHFALGNNATYSGTVDIPFHEDGVIIKPTVKIDNRLIIENGKWKV